MWLNMLTLSRCCDIKKYELEMQLNDKIRLLEKQLIEEYDYVIR